MNKIRLFTLCAMVLLIILTGCGKTKNEEGNSFTATVLENNESHLLVEPEKGSAELSSADRIVVYVGDATLVDSQDKEITITHIETGKQVEVFYSGGIAESYPAQIQGCHKIRLLN